MSIEALKWAFEQEDVKPGPRFVLVALANRSDEEGIAFPSIKWIKRKTGYPDSNIRKYLDELESIGKLTKVVRRRDDGSNSSNEYRLALTQPGLALNTHPPVTVGSPPAIGGGTAAAGTPTPQQLEGDPPATGGHEKKQLNKTTHTKKQGSLTAELPDYVPAEAWEAFIADRKERKKPLTTRAQDMALLELAKLHAAGHDLEAVLNRSIRNGWAGLFAPKDSSPRAPGQRSDVTDDAIRLIEQGSTA